MSKRKSNNFSTILSSFIILLLVAGVVGFLFVFTDNFSTDIKTFYVKQGNDTIISDRENYNIVVGKEYKFEVNTTFGSTEQLEISVVPNTNENASYFDYLVNGAYYQFAYEKDITRGFDMKAYDNYFVFTANKDLHDILQMNYPDKTISNCPTAIDSDIAYFRLVIALKDGTQKININFNLISE